MKISLSLKQTDVYLILNALNDYREKAKSKECIEIVKQVKDLENFIIDEGNEQTQEGE